MFNSKIFKKYRIIFLVCSAVMLLQVIKQTAWNCNKLQWAGINCRQFAVIIFHCLFDCNITDCCCDDVWSWNGLEIEWYYNSLMCNGTACKYNRLQWARINSKQFADIIFHCLLDSNITDCCCDDVPKWTGDWLFWKRVILVVVFQEGSPR